MTGFPMLEREAHGVRCALEFPSQKATTSSGLHDVLVLVENH